MPLQRSVLLALLAAVLLTLPATVQADYIKDRDAAIKLYWADKTAEALAAFNKLAGESTTELQKSDALDWASRSAMKLRQFDQAMELARQIPTDSMARTAQARVLVQQRQWPAVLDLLKAEDVATWPTAVAAEAWALRGRAATAAEDFKSAAEAYAKAFELSEEHNAKAGALLGLGGARRALGELDAAVEAYQKVYTASSNIARQADAAVAVADIRLAQDKPADAVAELARIDLNKVPVKSLQVDLLLARGRAFAKQGDKAQALACYNEAAAHPGASDAQKRSADKAIKELQSAGS
jgi:tetratricopeptide (TPR) repeat protein